MLHACKCMNITCYLKIFRMVENRTVLSQVRVRTFAGKIRIFYDAAQLTTSARRCFKPLSILSLFFQVSVLHFFSVPLLSLTSEKSFVKIFSEVHTLKSCFQVYSVLHIACFQSMDSTLSMRLVHYANFTVILMQRRSAFHFRAILMCLH